MTIVYDFEVLIRHAVSILVLSKGSQKEHFIVAARRIIDERTRKGFEKGLDIPTRGHFHSQPKSFKQALYTAEKNRL